MNNRHKIIWGLVIFLILVIFIVAWVVDSREYDKTVNDELALKALHAQTD